MHILKPFMLTLAALHASLVCAQRMELDFNANWQFSLGDPRGAQQATFDDNTWRTLDVPHDWAFEAEYTKDATQKDRGGYKPGGIGWYRKSFELPEGWQDKRVSIHFDAVYMNSEVWINGQYLGKRPYGYIPFHYDLSEHLNAGRNTIAVRVDNSLEPSARWYHGCGIYAPVKLRATNPVHIAHDGVFITTPSVNDNAATVRIEVAIANQPARPVRATLVSRIYNGQNKLLQEDESPVQLDGSTHSVTQELKLSNPERWSPDSPTLYIAETILKIDGVSIDQRRTSFGVRTVRWDKDTGFWLNEKNIKLLGVADHLEAGPVGAAYPKELLRWKVQLLKDMGCNAIRTAHNPQVPDFYDICDELGMLVMDELFDGWLRKADQDYGKQAFDEWWERDLRTWLKANRNHPSIFIWSLGNETKGDIGAELVKACHELDPTRLTTSGWAGPDVVDVLGVNGHSERQHFFDHAPEKPFVSTEAPHTWQVRSYYRTKTWFRDGYPNKRQDAFPCPDLTEQEIFTYDWTHPTNRANRKQIFNSSYDNAMVRITARKNWELMRDLPWHSGHFRWTGFDYLGEAGYVHGGWPFRAFMGGALDLAGFEKDLYYFYQSQWTKTPMVHILPHWTHPRMEAGTEIPVWVYSNCDEVELFLNGKSLGKDQPGTKWDEMQCEWLVPWTPGKLEAVGYRNGKIVSRTTQQTASAPAALELSTQGEDYPIVTAKQVDERGVLNSYAENRIHYLVTGPSEIISLESGNPVNTENNYGNSSRTAFFGLARCFLKNTAQTGDISLLAAAILGDKQLYSSKQIRIDVQSLAIRGAIPKHDLRILYSIDGSTPSLPYTGSIQLDTHAATVRAEVYDGANKLFSMSERFGPQEGLYWGTGASEIIAGGDQAESATFDGAQHSNIGVDFEGTGYLDFGKNRGAFVEWYQENDGGAGEALLKIRYTGDRKSMLELSVNGKSKELKFPATGKFGIEWHVLEVPVQIDAGANVIRLTTTRRINPGIDSIYLN
jgi:beta-galactosidase